jgi:hypothetical protein
MMIRRYVLLGLIAAVLLGCGSSRPYTLGPVKTEDPDRQPIPKPEETQENMYWDRINLSFFHQIEKGANLNWTGRKVGQALGLAGPDEADNVNVMDEPPNSSWYTRRHYYHHLSPHELAVGPNDRDTTGIAAGPDTSGTWTVVSGKSEGASRGFVMEDPRGDTYVMKLDGPKYPEMTTSAETISTKILYGAGYHVPQNTVTYFRPDQLEIAESATIRKGNSKRSMQREDLTNLLDPYEPNEQGKIRALASKFVDGTPLGPFDFYGTKRDNPNDLVRHEQRRELRGLKVISSWLNDTDRRAANTLRVYTDGDYIRHYIFDMGSTLGANASSPHLPVHGQAYRIDLRKIPFAALSFGAYPFPWWEYDPTPQYPSVGYYRADVFKPGQWVMTYPNPAFQKQTRRDAFWGAKQVMSFRDEDLRAIVETAQMTNPEAEAYLLDVLKKRRDKIGRYWFQRINPLDRFAVEKQSAVMAARDGGSSGAVGSGKESGEAFMLTFDDLSVTYDLRPAEGTRYTAAVRHDGDRLAEHEVAGPAVPLRADGRPLPAVLTDRGATSPHDRVIRIDLRTHRPDGHVSRITRVYVHVPGAEAGNPPRVVGLERE